MHLIGLWLMIGLAGCVADPDDDPVGTPGGKGDEAGDRGTSYRFHGWFRLFHGIDSQLGELSGSFEMSRPDPGQIDASVRDVEYELALDADSFHAAYTLRSATDRDRSYAEWRRTGLQIFIEQVSPLTADAERSVIDAGSGTVSFLFYPYCDAEARNCQPGALSGFDFAGASVPEMRLDPLGPFELTAY